MHGDLYQRESQYIGPVNNDVRVGYPINESFKQNLQRLNKFVMVKGLQEWSNFQVNSASFLHKILNVRLKFSVLIYLGKCQYRPKFLTV